MSKLVTIYGGSGFVGRHVARRMAQAGWRVRVAVRRPNEAIFVRPFGVPGQVEPILCNIRDERSVRAAMAGADAVINCVGLMNEGGRNRFGAVHVEGAERVARLAAETGVAHLVHVSALGADASSDSVYSVTKARGEAAVLAAFPAAMILRPSVVFGIEDQFFNRLAAQVRATLIVPVVSQGTRFQPVHVEDVAEAAELGASGQAAPGIYELGGPDVITMREAVEKTLAVTLRRRALLPLARGLVAPLAAGLDLAQKLTGGLFTNSVITRDQLRLLGHDNVVSPGARGLADLGVKPTSIDSVLPEYLWRFRETGQYAAIKASARV